MVHSVKSCSISLDALPLVCGSATGGSGGGEADSGCWKFTPDFSGKGDPGTWSEIGSLTWEDIP